MTYLYKNWAYMGPVIAVYVMIVLLSNASTMDPLVFWIWLQFPIYLIHEFEEHAWPGGFKAFVNKEVFKNSDENTPLNDKRIFWINILAVWVAFPICAVLSQQGEIVFGILIVYFSLFNATIHIVTTVLKKKYNPGFFASLFLYFPPGLYTLWLAEKEGVLDLTMTLMGLLVAFLAHALIIILSLYWNKNALNSKE
ncbi:MAG TPA: HXXEE domain-containing protein [Alphaproteobacteria bacterium]|nr:MAG: hypothetical protein B7X84_08770 [Alphaproteobacteria bacterium 17-39-52]HQS85069.1 HXXEE domain-containing protein [Alphaproteobacteria bacterium]HQS94807.1 HXXEE domain-containing protein [Alphaproteobacteria bacterium]